jgi:hypothetical protein
MVAFCEGVDRVGEFSDFQGEDDPTHHSTDASC